MPIATAETVEQMCSEVRELDRLSGFKPRVYTLCELEVLDADSLRKIANNAAVELDLANINILPHPLTPDTLRQIANRMQY